MNVYVLEVQSGSMHDDTDTMLFDSVWVTRAAAEAYAAEKFNQRNWMSDAPRYEITEVQLQGA